MENKIKKLLSEGKSNTKTAKNYLKTFILYLSPFKENSFSKNLCAFASKGCTTACLFTAGLASVYSSVNKARRAKTDYFLSEQINFLTQLLKELQKINDKAKTENKKNAIRLNGTSDVDFMRLIKSKLNFDILSLSNLMFYDYTKNITKALAYKDCKNYTVTFSHSETNWSNCEIALKNGINVAIVFDEKKPLPEIYKGYKVIDGDVSDIEMMDHRGIIIGLRAKGKAKKDKTGFVVRNY